MEFVYRTFWLPVAGGIGHQKTPSAIYAIAPTAPTKISSGCVSSVLLKSHKAFKLAQPNFARFSRRPSLSSSKTMPEIPLAAVLRNNFLTERNPLDTFSRATSSDTTLLLNLQANVLGPRQIGYMFVGVR